MRAILNRLSREQSGFMLIETIASILVLTIGVLGMMMGFDTSRRLSLVSERHSAMALVAQREIERIQGMGYVNIALTSSPATSTDSTNPDYYVVAGSPPSYEYSQTNGVSETVVVDATNGQVTPVQSWSQGNLSGSIYDFVSYVSDSRCSPGCTGTQNYKRITVAVTMAGAVQPTLPVYSSSVTADPAAAPAGGITNGNSGNPLTDPGTTCKNALGTTVACYSPIDSGNPNTFYLHDTSALVTPGTINADNATHPTVGVIVGLLCTVGVNLGCPVPDAMDNNPPTGVTSQPLYHYSTDQPGSSTSPGGRLLQPTCSGTSTCGGSQGAACTGSGCGTGSPNDCTSTTGLGNLLSVQTGFWVSSPVTANLTLTGDGGLSMYTQAVGGASALVSFCIQIYDVPPSGGVAGSLANLLTTPPVAIGGAGYVPATIPATGGNWPATSPSVMSYTFNFRGSSGSFSIAAGHRIGVRIWAKANLNTAISLLYDNPRYPTSIQLNSQ
ncbi:MAG: type IV pilus modification PilV family protein [Solirubrobacteraceae bacterium]